MEADKYGIKNTEKVIEDSSVTNNTQENGDSKEDKLRKRQEKIRQWKLKKEQEEKEEEAEKKKILRQRKLEEWKRKKEESEATKPTPVTSTAVPAPGPKKLLPLLKSKKIQIKTKRSSIFVDDEDEDGPLKKKIPTFFSSTLASENGPNITETSGDVTGNEVDELDIYLETLQKKERAVEKVSAGADSVEVENVDYDDMDDNVDEAIDAENKLLSSRIEKLQQREKILQAVDHEKMNYQPFRKSFYHEPSELSKLSADDVDVIRLLLDGIKVRGLGCPKPIQKWSQLGLPLNMTDVIENKLQYEEPSSIQCQALPAIMSGRDVIGVAKTGSGKTLSFVLPMIRHIQGSDPRGKDDGPIAVIMSPTRELSLQIYKEITNFSNNKKVDISASCCYGGAPIQTQIADLKRGVDIIVGTPGRIIDLLAANGGRVTNLNRVTYLVLDEADRMFDMGFEPQVLRVFSQVRPDRQTVLFSATFPKKMELIARKLLDNPVEIIVGGRSIVAPEIKQKVELFEEEDMKLERLFEIIKEFQSVPDSGKLLIFVEKQTSADELLVKLLKYGLPCLAIHGGKDQMDRKHSIKEFSSLNSGVDILIATSIAARGLDVKGLNMVINYDSPNHMEDYVHRAGRTGRAGHTGTAVTFVTTNQERSITDLVKAMRLSKIPDSEIDPKLLEIYDNFMKKVKSGKEKFSFGFGGKGLDKLQEVRESKQEMERVQYGEEGTPSAKVNVKSVTNSVSSTTVPERGSAVGASVAASIQFPDFDIIEGRAPETSGPDKGKYHARIAVNDLPQTARWNIVSRESLSKIIETTSTSITNKGQYYPPGSKLPEPTVKNGKEVAPPPKLYLLVEGLTEASVKEAIAMLRQKMVEGLETAVKEESRGPVGKYKV